MTQSLVDEFARFVGSVPHRPIQRSDGATTRVWDLGEGPPIVLLHGIAASRRVFFRIVPQLAKRHRVIVPWLRGEERFEPKTTHAHLLDDVASLLEQLDLSDATLLGVSFGGTVALGYGGRADSRISRVVVQGTFPTFRLRRLDRVILGASRAFPASWGSAYFVRRVHRGPEIKLFAEYAPGIDQLMPQWCGQTPFRTLTQRTRMIASLDLRDAMSRIQVPLVMAHGARDRVVPRAYFESLKRARPDAKHVWWPEAGHNVALTHPELLESLAAR